MTQASNCILGHSSQINADTFTQEQVHTYLNTCQNTKETLINPPSQLEMLIRHEA